MWRDHPFSQRNRTTERTVGMEVGGDRDVGRGGWTTFEKGDGRVGKQYGGIFIKREVRTPLPTMYRD